MRPRVCIVHLENGVQNPKVHFQVTIDDSRKSSLYIRFGHWSDGKGQGDELTGWFRKEAYVIDEVLGELVDGKVVPIEESKGMPGEQDLAETYYPQQRAA